MEPAIQYVKTSDGVNIAYWTMGEGIPFVSMPPLPFSNIEAEWRNPEFRGWYERLAENRMLVRYDGRGMGLSDRDPADFSMELQARDLEAVVEELGVEACVLFASFFAGPVAISYAVRRPERVSHLILWHSFARASDYRESSQQGAFMALMEQDWELFTETLAHARRGWSAGDPSRDWAALIRESVTAEALRAGMETFLTYDVSDLLSKVGAPTLVLQRRDFLPTSGVVDEKSALAIPKALASGIPDGRLVLVDGDTGSPAAGDVEPVVRAIDGFLGLEYDAAAAPEIDEVASRAAGVERLTAREREVLRLVAMGESNKEIAESLTISVHTVERHLANIYGKITVRGRAEAAAWAVKRGLA